MKYSICIVAYKAVEDLRRCLDSINFSAIQDAEIVIWDNSPEPLFAETQDKAWSPRVPLKALYNGENYGFAEGCNRAAKMAQGEYLIFLNPDTIVYGNWAFEMVKYFGHKGEKPIGAVGPISDFVAGLQHFSHHMQPMDTPEDMAATAKFAMANRAVATKLLIGFCLAMPAALYREIGGMDSQLFLGCDDLDLSMRLREAGYQLLIASDVFVHHAGHKSFEAAGTEESFRLIDETESRFRAKLLAKYGDYASIPTSDALWGCPIFYTGELKPQKLSISMIVREEERNLEVLLPQLGFADEVVIVDTKPDRDYPFTNAHIEEWAEQVAPVLKGKVKAGLFPWVNDFAAARNHSLSLCTGDWVLWLDADDRLPPETGAFLRAAMDKPGPATVQKLCHFALILKDMGPEGRFILNSQPRLFPRLPGLVWEQAVHESYNDRANAMRLAMITVDNIIIEHHGYKDRALNAKKQARNLAILATQPDSPHKLMHEANSYLSLGRWGEARATLQKLLDLGATWPGGLYPPLVANTRFQIAQSYYKEFMAEMKAWVSTDPAARGAFPTFPPQIKPLCENNDKPDALFLLAEHHFFKGEITTAKPLYERYASFNYTDAYGCQQDTFESGALMRLEAIAKVGERMAAAGEVALGA